RGSNSAVRLRLPGPARRRGRLEVDELEERPQQRVRGPRPQDDPLVLAGLGAFVFDRPTEIREEEADRAPHPRQLYVVQEHDAALAEQPRAVIEIDEHALEAVVRVDERKVEAPAIRQQAGEQELGLLLVEL